MQIPVFVREGNGSWNLAYIYGIYIYMRYTHAHIMYVCARYIYISHIYMRYTIHPLYICIIIQLFVSLYKNRLLEDKNKP